MRTLWTNPSSFTFGQALRALICIALTFGFARAEDAPATRPANADAPAEKKADPPADEDRGFRAEVRGLQITLESDLGLNTKRIVDPSLLQLSLRSIKGISIKSVAGSIATLQDDTGRVYKQPTESKTFWTGNMATPDTPIYFTVPLSAAPLPPAVIQQIKGELTIRGPQEAMPALLQLEKVGDSVAITDKLSAKVTALSRTENRIVVGVTYEGFEKSLYDQSNPPYLSRTILQSEAGVELPKSIKTSAIPQQFQAVYTLDLPSPKDKPALKLYVVTEFREYKVPIDIKFKPAPKVEAEKK